MPWHPDAADLEELARRWRWRREKMDRRSPYLDRPFSALCRHCLAVRWLLWIDREDHNNECDFEGDQSQCPTFRRWRRIN